MIDGYRELMLRCGDVARLNVLLSSPDRSIEETDAKGYTCLHGSCGVKGQIKAAKHLLKFGANPNAKDLDKATALHCAAFFGDWPNLVSLLLELRASEHPYDTLLGHIPPMMVW